MLYNTMNLDTEIIGATEGMHSQLQSSIIENINSLNHDSHIAHTDNTNANIHYHHHYHHGTADIDDETEINDLTDSSSIVTDTEEESEALKEARRQWEESLVQLNQVINWVILPLLGKFLGRKVARWTWKWVAGRLYQ